MKLCRFGCDKMKRRKMLAHNTCVTHASFVHGVKGTNCQTQNGSTQPCFHDTQSGINFFFFSFFFMKKKGRTSTTTTKSFFLK